jgi:hypothetical protein
MTSARNIGVEANIGGAPAYRILLDYAHIGSPLG